MIRKLPTLAAFVLAATPVLASGASVSAWGPP